MIKRWCQIRPSSLQRIGCVGGKDSDLVTMAMLLRKICVCNGHSERRQWDGGRRDRQPGGKYIPSAVEAQFTGLITSDSSQRSALINSSEEMAQARDTSTCVTFNALNSTSSPRILDSLLYCSMDAREEKQNLQMLGYDLNFETTLSRS